MMTETEIKVERLRRLLRRVLQGETTADPLALMDFEAAIRADHGEKVAQAINADAESAIILDPAAGAAYYRSQRIAREVIGDQIDGGFEAAVSQRVRQEAAEHLRRYMQTRGRMGGEYEDGLDAGLSTAIAYLLGTDVAREVTGGAT